MKSLICSASSLPDAMFCAVTSSINSGCVIAGRSVALAALADGCGVYLTVSASGGKSLLALVLSGVYSILISGN